MSKVYLVSEEVLRLVLDDLDDSNYHNIYATLRAILSKGPLDPVAMFKEPPSCAVYIETFGGLNSVKELVGKPLYALNDQL